MRSISVFLGFALLSIVLGAFVVLLSEILLEDSYAIAFLVLGGWLVSILMGCFLGTRLGLRTFERLPLVEAGDAEYLSKPLPRPSRRVRWTAGAILGRG